MVIKELYVCDSVEIRKVYKFNEVGVNIILGEKREEHEETNGVGKSTMVECISILLGKNISDFYSNNEKLLNNNIFITLKVEHKGNNLYLARVFSRPKYGYILHGNNFSLDLSEWEELKAKGYRDLIDSMEIEKPTEGVTFAALREYLIRNEKSGFIDILLPNRPSAKQHVLLNYLFTLPCSTETSIKNYQNKIDKLSSEIKLIDSLNINIGKLKLDEEELQAEIKEIGTQIAKAQTIKKYNKDSKKYSVLKSKLNELQKEIFESEHIIKQYERNIEDLQKKVDQIKQLEDVENFYTDLVGFFPKEIKQNFSKVQEFYDFMVENRGSYFMDKIVKLQSNLKLLYTEKKEIEIDIEESSQIIQSNDFIEDISILLDDQRKKEIELAEVRVRIKDYERRNMIVDEINAIQHEILRVNSMNYDQFQSYKEIIERLQRMFNSLMEITYQQHGFLSFEYDNRISSSKQATTGRIKISCSIPDERSHGRLHMKINIFDLTSFLNRCIRREGLNFLIHDGSYSNPDPYVKGILLNHINDILLENKIGQYFVTLNKNDLLEQNIAQFDSKGMIIAKLDRQNDDKNRFFGFKL